jgi:hypothetical protein
MRLIVIRGKLAFFAHIIKLAKPFYAATTMLDSTHCYNIFSLTQKKPDTPIRECPALSFLVSRPKQPAFAYGLPCGEYIIQEGVIQQ